MNKRNFINKICIADLEKLGVKCNITNKKLRSSNEQLKNLLELIREGVTFSDETGHFYIYNSGMEKLTGYSMKEANASPDFTSLLYPNLKDREMALRGIVELLEKRTRRDAEAVITTKSGELKNVCISSALIPHKERKLFLSVYQDITRRKKVEETLREAYNKLKEMQGQLIHAEKMEAIGRLASGVAHEVKNPLGIILQGINYLEGKISPDQKEMFEIVQMMKSNVKRADNIVGELLEFSRS
jgi:PAS domain S-box-containing protein